MFDVLNTALWRSASQSPSRFSLVDDGPLSAKSLPDTHFLSLCHKTMQAYQYRPLESKSSKIRLLQAEPSSDASASIVLTLRHASLKPGEKFIALSYTWGEEAPTFAVTIRDGHSLGRFDVRRNLHAFLQTARHSPSDWSSDWIWIDQICINQQDHVERCHQVSQMGILYSLAQATIVWPGVLPATEAPPFELPQSDMDAPIFRPRVVEKISIIPHRSWEGTRTLSPSTTQMLSLFTGRYLIDLLLAPYWKRLWVVQEIILAKEVHIVLFGHIWGLRDLWHAFDKINRQSPLVKNDERIRSQAEWFERRLVYFMSWRQTKELSRRRLQQEDDFDSGWLNWDDALSICEGTDCTIPLDRIYGLMGFVAENMRLPVDYTISQTGLLREILMRHMQHGGYSWDNRWDELFVILSKWRKHVKAERDSTVRDPLTVLQDLEFKRDHEERRRKVEQVVRHVLGELGVSISGAYTSIEEGVEEWSMRGQYETVIAGV